MANTIVSSVPPMCASPRCHARAGISTRRRTGGVMGSAVTSQSSTQSGLTRIVARTSSATMTRPASGQKCQRRLVLGSNSKCTGWSPSQARHVRTERSPPDPFPGAFGTEPLGINDLGQILGQYAYNNREHGFLYSDRVFTTIDDPSAVGSTYARGMNDVGQIVGTYVAGNTLYAFLATRCIAPALYLDYNGNPVFKHVRCEDHDRDHDDR